MDLNEIFSAAWAVLGGGFTGYVTNDYAVKMIFKEYYPFGIKVGGVIIKTREKFVENVSALVERDIINNRTIENELEKFEFQKAFYNLVADILKKHLYNNTADINVSQIPGSEMSFYNFERIFESHANTLTEELIGPLLDLIDADVLLSKEQSEYLAEQIFTILLQELEENDVIEDFINGFYRENKEAMLSDFIAPKVFKSLDTNLKEATNGLHQTLQLDFDERINTVIKEICGTLELKKVISNLEQSVKEKTLMQLLGKDRSANVANDLLQKAVQALKTPEGQKVLINFADKIISILKTVKSPLLSIMSEELNERFENYLEKYLPGLIEKILLWLRKNKDEINYLLNQSVDDVLDAESSGFFNLKGKAKKMLKDAFVDNVADKYQVVEKVLKYIKDETDIKVISIELSKEIIKYLKTKEVSEIIGNLEEKGFIKADYIVKLINNNIEENIGSLDLSLFDNLFEHRIGDFVDIDLSRNLEYFITNILLEQLKNKFLYSPKGTKLLQNEISDKIMEISTGKIGVLCSEESFAELASKTNDKVIRKIELEKAAIKETIKQEIAKNFCDKKIRHLCSENTLQKINKITADKSVEFVHESIPFFLKTPVKNCYDYLNAQRNTAKSLTGMAMELSKKNLHFMLEGRIRAAVAANLSKLPDAEIQKIVENFMGKELKPINWFGALLGGATGLLTYDLLSSPALLLFSNFDYILTIVVYSLVGYGTNVIALKMIFQPYYEKKILGLKIPFTPGVISKQKPRFAKSMAEFVNEKLLTANAVTDIFLDKRQVIAENFKENIAADNYKKLQQALIDNSDIIADKVLVLSIKYVEENKEKIINNLMEEVKDISLSKFDYSKIETQFNPAIAKKVENMDRPISVYINDLLQSEKSLQQLLPSFFLAGIYASTDKLLDEKIRILIDYAEDKNKIMEIVAALSDDFDSLIDKSMYELITDKQMITIKESISSYLLTKLQDKESREQLFNWIEEKFSKELRPEKRIDELFGGMLVKLLQQNAKFIINEIIDKAQDKLKDNRSIIKKEVYRRFRESSGTGMKAADTVLDIESSIYDVVDDLVEEKFPEYLGCKKKELQDIFISFIRTKIAASHVSDIGIELNAEGIINIVDSLLSNKTVEGSLKGISDNLVDYVLKMPLKDLLSVVSVKEVLDVYKIFAKEIEEARINLTRSIKEKRTILVDEAGTLIAEIIDKALLNLPVKQLCADISQEDIRKIAKYTIQELVESDSFNKQLCTYIKTVIKEIKYKQSDDLLDFAILKHDSLLVIDKILADEVALQEMASGVEKSLGRFFKSDETILTTETKDYIINIVVISLLDSLEDHILNIINAVNVQRVTEQQVNAMEPAEIEAMFNSFAKPYFNKIEKYGLSGGAIGLITKVVENFIN